MNDTEEFNRLYSNVSDNISSALADIASLNVEHKDGKREIGNITEKLHRIQDSFNQELHQLQTHAEWDTFTLAFFGETNAGKSTIIESLRILFNEESRQALLQQNADDLEQFEQALNTHFDQVREGLYALYSEYTDEIIAIKKSIDSLRQLAQREADARNQILQQEAQARLEIEQQEALHRQKLVESEAKAKQDLAEQESKARLLAEQQEASERLQLEQKYASSRFKTRLMLFGLGGILIGAASAVAWLKFVGA